MTGASPLGVIGGVMMKRGLVGDTRFRTELFTAFGFKTKVLYYMCVYFPFSYPLVVRIKKILGKLR